MSELTTLARPYARAAFEYAVENKTVSVWSEMLSFTSSVAKDATIVKVLTSNRAPAELAELFINICEGQLNKQTKNFINLLAENGRLSVLPRIYELFLDLENEHKKEIDASVISAYALSKQQKKNISKSLEKRLARKVNLNCSIDKKLIAGMVITAGDLVIDSTAKGQLIRLSNTLQS
jgi:F-type H+-transporting ATPase subunit delta